VNRIGFAQAGFFGCTSVSCTGFFFDGRIPARQSLAQLRLSTASPTRHHTENTETRKSKICSAKVGRVPRPTRKSHRNTENKNNRLDGTHVVPSPVPLANFQFAQLRPVLWTGPPTRNPRKHANQRFALLRLSAFSVQPANQRNSRKGGQGRAARRAASAEAGRRRSRRP